MSKDNQDNQFPDKEVFKPINPNRYSSGALARERFKRALSLTPAESPEAEELRKRLTEEEGQDGS